MWHCYTQKSVLDSGSFPAMEEIQVCIDEHVENMLSLNRQATQTKTDVPENILMINDLVK